MAICAIRASCNRAFFIHMILPWRSAHPCSREILLSAHFFLASTIHPRALIEAWTVATEYREKSRRFVSLPDTISTRVAWSIRDGSILTWRDWSVCRRRKKRKEPRVRGGKSGAEERRNKQRTDRQTGGQKVKCPRRRIKWRFQIRSRMSVELSGRWKRWKGDLLPAAPPRGPDV